MTTKRSRYAVLILLLAVVGVGCGPASPAAPARKKLPGDEQYMLIPLPDPAADSATISLVNSYKPLAIPFLTQWAQQQQTGVIIDLRENESLQQQRAEYLVQRADAFSISVVFIWDRHSMMRAAHFMNMLETFPAVQAQRIGGTGGNKMTGSCFQP